MLSGSNKITIRVFILTEKHHKAITLRVVSALRFSQWIDQWSRMLLNHHYAAGSPWRWSDSGNGPMAVAVWCIKVESPQLVLVSNSGRLHKADKLLNTADKSRHNTISRGHVWLHRLTANEMEMENWCRVLRTEFVMIRTEHCRGLLLEDTC